MDYYIYNGELYHHGVKGMRWGVRRAKSKSKSEKQANRLQKKSRKKDLKKRRSMSDAELKKKIERLKLEKQFKDLTREDISSGKKCVSDILSSSGKKVLITAASGALAYGIKAIMTKSFNASEAASYIVPNPNKKK